MTGAIITSHARAENLHGAYAEAIAGCDFRIGVVSHDQRFPRGKRVHFQNAFKEPVFVNTVGFIDRIDQYLRHALDLGRLCANDPVCAHHEPNNVEEERFLLGAACHGCVLLAESSCERRNDFLDRALVVPTVDDSDAAFFSDEA